MINISEEVRSPIYEGYRANRVRSMFNVAKEQGSTHKINVSLPIDEKKWGIGLVVGASGTGKTTLGKKILGEDAYHQGFEWSKDKPVIDEIGGKTFDKATAAFASVGLGSVPSWLRPFHVLSMGEQFRAEMARVIISAPEKIVFDEFTSVVDRQVAQVGAAAFSKSWRKTKGQAVLLSCHYDIIDWLQPDWVLDSSTWEFTWRCLRRKPEIKLDIYNSNMGKAWDFFKAHHYLDLPLPIASTYYVGTVKESPVAHLAVTTSPGLKSARFVRLVVLPQWQGAGIGMSFLECIAQMWLDGDNHYKKKMTGIIRTSHPGLVFALNRSSKWVHLSSSVGGNNRKKSAQGLSKSHRGNKASNRAGYGGHLRATAGFRYVGS